MPQAEDRHLIQNAPAVADGKDACTPVNQDRFGRTINYLRLSVTDRCNLRCCYCMPAAGVAACSHADILRYEQLLKISRAAVGLGIEKVRVTGGEPLVRKGLIRFLEQLSAIPGLNEVSLTTNGILLAAAAQKLKRAGVDRLNISLDSLQPATFAKITRGGELRQVWQGIDTAERSGLKLKLNMVVMRGVNDHEVEDFAALSLEKPWSVRFIEYMPTIREKAWRSRIVPGAAILHRLQQRFPLMPLPTSRMCGPARPFRIAGALGTIGVITPISEHFCSSCNRIRVTATGMAKSCLFAGSAMDLKPFLSGDEHTLQTRLLAVIGAKEACHDLSGQTSGPEPFAMATIGG
ncbi:MAG TPA: GTP 3',8-cyclase MoaA [Desulfuromonadales bacterium]|nr:GTP 3',8-cyclase MoaA [Desulfuromonadales bacterium]